MNYQDQECTQVARNRCETIPAHNQCQQIPYGQNVCGMETVMKPQEYACVKEQVEQQSMKKKVSSALDVEFKTNGLQAEFPIQLVLRGENPEKTSFALETALPQEPELLVVLKKKEMKIVSETKDEIGLEGLLQLELLDPRQMQAVFPKRFLDVSLKKKTSLLSAQISGSLEAKGTVEMTLKRRGKLIAELKDVYPSQRVRVVKDRRKTALTMDLANLLLQRIGSSDEYEMTLKLGSVMSIDGEILNAKQPVREKTFSRIRAWVE